MSEYNINTLLSDVEKDLGMEAGALAPDENNQSVIRIDGDGGIIVSLDYLPDQARLVLSTELDPVAETAEAAVHKAMLRANFLYFLKAEANSITIGVEPKNNLPVLMRRVRLNEVRAADLIPMIEGLADLARELNATLGVTHDPPPEEEPPLPPGNGFIRV